MHPNPKNRNKRRFARLTILAALSLLPFGNVAMAQTSCPAPEFETFPTDIVLQSTAGTCSPIASYAVTTKGTGSVTFYYQLTGATYKVGTGTGTGLAFNKGVTNVLLRASNGCSSSTYSFKVTVLDDITLNMGTSDIVVNSDADKCGATVTYPTPTMSGTCMSCIDQDLIARGFSYLGNFGDHSYYLTPEFGSWTKADEAARSIGGNLTAINSFDENQFIGTAVPDTQSLWIGLTDREIHREWKWTNGDPVTYKNWCHEQPDDWRTNQDYGLMHSPGTSGTAHCWDDAHDAVRPMNTGDVLNLFKGVVEMNSCSLAPTLVSGPASGRVFPVGTTIVTYKVVNATGEASLKSFKVTVLDKTVPVLTCPADITLPANSTSTGTDITGVATATDNCGAVNVTSSDVVEGTVTTRTWTATDANGNVSTCTQKITVPAGNSNCGYVLVAKKDIHLHENSTVNGNVGVTGVNGKVHVEKNSSVAAPGFVMAAKIDIKKDAVVDNPIYTVANPTLPAMQYPGNASTANLPNYVVTSSGTNNNNYKDLTVNEGLAVTLGGNLYKKIKIKKNAVVTFSQPDVTLEGIDIDENVTLLFSGNTNLRVKDRVKLHKAVTVNPAPSKKLVFYVDDPLTSNDNDEKFDVDGEGTSFTGSVLMPSGKIRVHGGGANPSTTMRGFFYAEKIQSDGKNVVWIGDCGASSLRQINNSAVNNSAAGPAYGTMIYPNPTKGEFNLQFENVAESAEVRITDLQGRVIETRTISTEQMPSASFNLSGKSAGVYLIEIRQGELQKRTKLIVQ